MKSRNGPTGVSSEMSSAPFFPRIVVISSVESESESDIPQRDGSKMLSGLSCDRRAIMEFVSLDILERSKQKSVSVDRAETGTDCAPAIFTREIAGAIYICALLKTIFFRESPRLPVSRRLTHNAILTLCFIIIRT